MPKRGESYTPDRYGIPQPPPAEEWHRYLLKRIPPELRDSLQASAQDADLSVADVIRDILCQHYRQDCPPISRAYPGTLKPGTDQMLLRLQPELWRAIRDDQKISERPFRSLIIEALEKRYAHQTD